MTRQPILLGLRRCAKRRFSSGSRNTPAIPLRCGSAAIWRRIESRGKPFALAIRRKNFGRRRTRYESLFLRYLRWMLGQAVRYERLVLPVQSLQNGLQRLRSVISAIKSVLEKVGDKRFLCDDCAREIGLQW